MTKSARTQKFLLAVGLMLTALTLPAQAEQTNLSPIQSVLSAFSSVFRPPNDEAPQRTVPAGSRDEARCSGDSISMQPLTPEVNDGLTTEENPVLWMDIPSTRAQEVLLVYKTEAGYEHARSQLRIPESTAQGAIAFQLPETVPGLSVGQNYQWTISVLCDGYLSPYDPFFSGWIRREQPSSEITQALASASIIDQAEILERTGYWYDLVTLILENQEAFRDSQQPEVVSIREAVLGNNVP